MIIIDDFDQLSEQWFQERLGNPGASNFDRIVTNVKGEPSKKATDYMYELAAETLSGFSQESHTSKWMQRGNDLEQEARDFFEFRMDMSVRQVALIYPDEKKMYHCSPDGLTEDGGGLELKCPKPKTHIKYLLENKFPATEYNAQVQGSLLVSGLSHWYFCSYAPGLNPFIVRITPDEKYIQKLQTQIEKFCADLSNIIRKLK